MRLLPFLLRVWLTGWLVARAAPYVYFGLLVFSLGLAWLTSSIAHHFGWDKRLIEWAQTHHVQMADHR